jgi:hypothetical protein
MKRTLGFAEVAAKAAEAEMKNERKRDREKRRIRWERLIG